ELIGTLSEYDLRRRPDLLIVIGTSLKIPGIKRMIKEMSRCVHDSAQRTQRAGAGKVIFINRDEPPRGWEDVFDYYIAGDADQAIDLLPIRPPSFKDNNAANLQTDSSGESSNSEATLVAKSAVMDIGNLCNPLENKAAAGVEQQGRKRPGRGAKSLAAILPPGRKVGLSRKTVAPPVKPKGRKITSMMKVVKTTATKPKQAAPRRRSQRTCHQQVDMPASPPVPS
ncbi:NAD-dependent deacetylase hst3, partial [Coemansia erecta]